MTTSTPLKGRALRRALESADADRVNTDLPAIRDTTELITPQVAQNMLYRNASNRPVNWKKVEEYAAIMARGEWQLHGQGIMLDAEGNLLTGQKRLWAVIYSGKNVYMRVSRGNPRQTAQLIDRGTPQSARDLASRQTTRKHSPTEASIARGIRALTGNLRPSVDELSETIAANAPLAAALLREIQGTRKTRSVLLLLAAISAGNNDRTTALRVARSLEILVLRLNSALYPQTAAQCWGRGAAFGLAMEHARKCVEDFVAETATRAELPRRIVPA